MPFRNASAQTVAGSIRSLLPLPLRRSGFRTPVHGSIAATGACVTDACERVRAKSCVVVRLWTLSLDRRARRRPPADLLSTRVCPSCRPVVERHVARGDDLTAAAVAGRTASSGLSSVDEAIPSPRAAPCRKTDNWLQHRKSDPMGTDQPTTRIYYTHRRSGPAFRSFSLYAVARSPSRGR